jgi:hypothetical protein
MTPFGAVRSTDRRRDSDPRVLDERLRRGVGGCRQSELLVGGEVLLTYDVGEGTASSSRRRTPARVAASAAAGVASMRIATDAPSSMIAG